jgi:AcrR family transcriptional regulator
MNLRQNNKEKEIIRRARDIFMKYGIRSVSMDDISRDLAISKKTLYQYFDNKHELLKHVLEYSFEDFDNTIQEILRKDQNAIDDLIEMSIKINMHIQYAHPSVNFDLQKYYPELFRENQQKKRSYAAHYIKENIIKGIREGVYRKDLNIDLISSLYIQKLEDVHDTDYHGSAISFETIFEVMFENHIRGIANKKGTAYFEKKKKAIKF